MFLFFYVLDCFWLFVFMGIVSRYKGENVWYIFVCKWILVFNGVCIFNLMIFFVVIVLWYERICMDIKLNKWK